MEYKEYTDYQLKTLEHYVNVFNTAKEEIRSGFLAQGYIYGLQTDKCPLYDLDYITMKFIKIKK